LIFAWLVSLAVFRLNFEPSGKGPRKMRTHSISSLALALMLSAITPACSKASAPQPPAEEILPAPPNPVHVDPRLPPLSLAEAFPDCTWAETRGAGMSLWAYDCPAAKIVADETLPGLVRVHAGEDAPAPSTVVQLFDIAEAAPIDSIVAAVQAASPAPDVTLCTLQPSQAMAGWHEFMPTGTLRDAYGKFTAGETESPSMPCGQLGPSESGGRYFKMLPGSTSKVAVVHMPSDIPSFDIKTLSAVH
jgi:hypothetical protein